VAPEADLFSAIVIEGGDVAARILGGMTWATRKKVRIINMSLGIQGSWVEFLRYLRIFRANDVLPVVAIGNEGPGTSRTPGNYGAEVLSVGALGQDGTIPTWSSSTTFDRNDDPDVPDLIAPGQCVLSASPGGRFGLKSGTSMAAAHIAGLAAVLMSAKPDRTAAEIETAIFKSCKPLAGQVSPRGGRGLPDAVEALKML